MAAAEQQAERTRLAHDAQLATTEQKEAELQALRVAKEEEVSDAMRQVRELSPLASGDLAKLGRVH